MVVGGIKTGVQEQTSPSDLNRYPPSSSGTTRLLRNIAQQCANNDFGWNENKAPKKYKSCTQQTSRSWLWLVCDNAKEAHSK